MHQKPRLTANEIYFIVGENTACTNDIKMPNQFEIKSEYAILARTGFHTKVLEKG